MEMSAIEIIDPPVDLGSSEPMLEPFRLTIEFHETYRRDNVDVDSPPILVAVTDDSSSSDTSSVPDDQLKLVDVPLGASQEKRVKNSHSIMADLSTDCMTDSIVRFLCPFDQTALTRHNSINCCAKGTFDALTECRDLDMFRTSPESQSDWLSPIQSCIPSEWDDVSNQRSPAKSEKVLLNRSSACKTSDRKSAHIKGLCNSWHYGQVNFPIREVRSWTDSESGTSMASSSSAPAVYYDSEPEVLPSRRPTLDTHEKSIRNQRYRSCSRKKLGKTPKYKRFRPFPIHTNGITAGVDRPFCSAPKNASTGSNNKFFSSPRSVMETAIPEFNGYYGVQEPDFDNNGEVKEFIQELIHGQVQLVWHRAGTHAPVSVTGWFEYGSQLDTTVVFPKFVWRPTFQPGLERKVLSATTSRGHDSIQLLTIVRVVTPPTLDRTLYPFARMDRCCCIIAHDGSEFVFESPSSYERDWFALRFKALVARLASSVIVHDEGMLREFFSPCAGFPASMQTFA